MRIIKKKGMIRYFMRKALFVTLGVIALSPAFSQVIMLKAAEGDVEINEAVFPDTVFREYVEDTFDTDKDGFLSRGEIETIETVDCSDKEIGSLTGIEFFTNMQMLFCGNNKLTTLDLSNNKKLVQLNCSSNQLQNLDMSSNTLIEKLDCMNNQLVSLDLNDCASLRIVECEFNQLTDLDLCDCSSLIYLRCDNNNLTRLDLSHCNKVGDIVCYNNQLSNIDISGCTLLKQFYCEKNNLNHLDISTCPVLLNVVKTLEYTEEDNTRIYRDAIGWPMMSYDNSVTVITEESTDIVVINALNFPDANFRKYVSEMFDKDNDGILTRAELDEVEYIDCSGMEISDLKGIEYFTSLTNLFCTSNNLTSLDMSKNTNLLYLSCLSNQLTTLDVSKNASLKWLYCQYNQLSELDVSGNSELNLLYCFDNQLTNLDVRNNRSLQTLCCDVNQLTELDVANNTLLKTLWTSGNPLKSLDIRNCRTLLEGLEIWTKEEGAKSVLWTDASGFPRLSIGIGVELITETTPSESVTEIYDDIKEGAWFVPAVQYVYDNHIMSGTNGGKSFSPNSNLTREQFTQVLYSNEGKPAVSIQNPFSDVKAGAWYANSVLWAKENGIVSGKKDGTFGVGNNITRQDFAMMLYSYAKYKNYDLSKNSDAIDNFSDKTKVQAYAKDAMNWAVTQGIISGKGGNRLDPAGKATRAECASMMMKLLQKNGK